MKKNNILKAALCLLLAAAVISLAGCGNAFRKESDDVREDFLIKCYTTNYCDRYEKFEAAGEYPTEQDVNDFYACIKPLCGKELYNSLKNSYTLIVYDKNAHDNGFSVVPTGIVFKEYETDGNAVTYLFIMTVQVYGSEVKSESLAGTITVEKNKIVDMTFTE